MTDGRGRNRRASVRITVSSMIQWDEHRPALAHGQQTGPSVDVRRDASPCEVFHTYKSARRHGSVCVHMRTVTCVRDVLYTERTSKPGMSTT